MAPTAFPNRSRVRRAKFADARELIKTPHYTSWQKMWDHYGGFALSYIVFAKIHGVKNHGLPRRAHFFPVCKPATRSSTAGIHGSSTTPDLPGKLQSRKKTCCIEIGRGHIVAFIA